MADALDQHMEVDEQRVEMDSEHSGVDELQNVTDTAGTDASSEIARDASAVDAEPDFDYLLWTELGERETKDKFYYVEVKQMADIRKVYERRKHIEDLVHQMDQTVGELHILEFKGVIEDFDTINEQTISQESRTECDSPTAWIIRLLYEKMHATKTFRLSVQLIRKDVKNVPAKVDLTVSVNSADGEEMAFINFESLLCSYNDTVSTIKMSTEKQMASMPGNARYNIVLRVSGCCGPSYNCPETWITSNIPQNRSNYNAIQKDLNMAIQLEYFSNVPLKCGVATISANKFMLFSRESLWKLIRDPNEPQNGETGKLVKLNIRCSTMPDVIKGFLKFLYTGYCEDLSSKTAIPLYFLAQDYKLEGLKLVCKNALIANLTVSNFRDTLLFNYQCPEEALREALLKYAKKHKDEIKELSEVHTDMTRDEGLCEAIEVTYIPEEVTRRPNLVHEAV